MYKYSLAMNKYTDRVEGKTLRQTAILEAIAASEIATQGDLVKALKKKGIEATQVSISRDIAELGLVKVAGVYRTAAGAAQDRELPLRAFVKNALAAGPNLTVVRCETGAAPRVALALDLAAMPGVIGTLAGDDTVFVAVESASAQRKLVDYLSARMP
jgi:transcriptional regulator of arginine metabolism